MDPWQYDPERTYGLEYVVTDSATGQYLTGPLPYAEARTLASLGGHTVALYEGN